MEEPDAVLADVGREVLRVLLMVLVIFILSQSSDRVASSRLFCNLLLATLQPCYLLIFLTKFSQFGWSVKYPNFNCGPGR